MIAARWFRSGQPRELRSGTWYSRHTDEKRLFKSPFSTIIWMKFGWLSQKLTGA
jgi:hypothetical protein